MIKYITTTETLGLRNLVLRNNAGLDKCIFPTDETEGNFHLGCFVEDRLASIATFFPEDCEGRGAGGFRLRGMATDPAFSGKGCGSDLIKFAINELRSANASYIWCHARSSAVGFYEKLGFEVISEEYEVPEIGPHFNMIKIIS
ncbi:GNAT family N-acetyltransferase [Pedobacter hiemivivus]|uniref:GNAT family N-acetyltransferase n=1 Tax=Pedobacter hiemivivus TaxID=2530454 RepID=A0A4U1GLJ1_9SPHI|nr:GNAT family N-acetyltransferase [Pedobacter hiemivivus]TCC98616.1 GNAT family N-acetyltransferase [Pedobacter hiemivivus]TKC65265.1 GNAT family N-acetyltransferase [Pedobacter hiemivivus]